MKNFLLICIVGVVTIGCTNASKLGEAVNEFNDNCENNLSATFTISKWNSSLILHCNSVKKDLL